jgi:hypothetical protein
MDHDPYCKAYYPDLLPLDRCTWCSVIKRVRADERNKIDLDIEYWFGYNNGYQDGYKDCQEEFIGYQELAKDWNNDVEDND